ncbi:ABC transporter permease [Egicoccus sp. AB-alg6-2]|uniref:ABC transporter permease n=1 Tax=Egicoccus sp. AB-alg6-2 TaxID=3242692 RepID=UPI00359DCEDB
MASQLRVRLEHAARPFRQASRTARVLVTAGLLITLVFGVVAFVGPNFYEYDGIQYRVEQEDGSYEQLPRLAPPSAEHPLGTTRDRYDVLARIIDGGRLALAVVFFSTLLAMAVGVPLGLLSGYRGGKLDRVIVTIMDAVYVFPPLLLAIIVAFLLQAGLARGVPSAAAAVGVVYIPQYFRVVRNHTLSIKQEPYVEAAKSLGAKERTVITRYVAFNVIQSVPVIFTLNAADAVLTLASLGFLGFGVQPPTPEWGYDISQAVIDITSGVWWTALWPGLAIVTLVAALTLVGEGLNDVINPLLRSRGAAGAKLDDAPATSAGGGVDAGPESTAGAAPQPDDVTPRRDPGGSP